MITAWRQTATLTWRGLTHIRHDPGDLVIRGTQPALVLVLFTYVFGGQMAGSTHDYLQFGLAGILAQATTFASMATAIALRTDISTGLFDRLRSLPISRFAPLAGQVVADVLLQLFATVVLLALGVALGFRFGTNPLAVLAALGLLVCFSVTLSWVAILIALLARTAEQVQIIALSAVMPLTFASGAFARVDSMPGWLRTFAKVNPVTTLSDSVRGLIAGGPVAAPAVQTLVVCVGLTLVLAPLALRTFQRRL
jgi:oleandomycin transport system permease protein